MTNPTGLTYAELTEAFLERGDLIDALHEQEEASASAIDGMDGKIEHLHGKIERLNATIRQLQEMAQHTNDAVEDAFGVKPSNEPDENHLALIEAAGYRLMRAEAAIERVRALPGYYDLNSGAAYAYVAADIRAALEV